MSNVMFENCPVLKLVREAKGDCFDYVSPTDGRLIRVDLKWFAYMLNHYPKAGGLIGTVACRMIDDHLAGDFVRLNQDILDRARIDAGRFNKLFDDLMRAYEYVSIVLKREQCKREFGI